MKQKTPGNWHLLAKTVSANFLNRWLHCLSWHKEIGWKYEDSINLKHFHTKTQPLLVGTQTIKLQWEAIHLIKQPTNFYLIRLSALTKIIHINDALCDDDLMQLINYSKSPWSLYGNIRYLSGFLRSKSKEFLPRYYLAHKLTLSTIPCQGCGDAEMQRWERSFEVCGAINIIII